MRLNFRLGPLLPTLDLFSLAPKFPRDVSCLLMIPIEDVHETSLYLSRTRFSQEHHHHEDELPVDTCVAHLGPLFQDSEGLQTAWPVVSVRLKMDDGSGRGLSR